MMEVVEKRLVLVFFAMIVMDKRIYYCTLNMFYIWSSFFCLIALLFIYFYQCIKILENNNRLIVNIDEKSSEDDYFFMMR